MWKSFIMKSILLLLESNKLWIWELNFEQVKSWPLSNLRNPILLLYLVYAICFELITLEEKMIRGLQLPLCHSLFVVFSWGFQPWYKSLLCLQMPFVNNILIKVFPVHLVFCYSFYGRFILDLVLESSVIHMQCLYLRLWADYDKV